ncbi:MAG: trypsin-like peptidase domain-containing protein [Gammaproteobacteria bacterium]
MQTGKLFSLLLKSITVGLAVAFVVLILRPDLLVRNTTVVEFKESTRPLLRATAAAPGGQPTVPVSYAGAVQLAAPSVVNINTTKVVTTRATPYSDDPLMQRFFGGIQVPRRQLESSLGSGVIVSEQGYILTNNHVIEGADEIQVALSDGRNVEAVMVGNDRETDLAVLKVDLNDLPSIIIGESDALLVGDVVLAIGNPFGVGQTVTSGIVSATGRNHLGINTFENFIQTDAAINPGNSGGALIDAQGHLIGINTAIFSRTGGSQGIGFAIPLSLAKGVMQQIIEHGHAIRGWLGIEVQAITPPLAESFGLSDTKGVIIAGVLSNGPADQAGLKRGDIVTRINGNAVDDPFALMNSVAGVAPGTNVKLEALRNGKSVALTAKVSQRPAPEGQGQQLTP